VWHVYVLRHDADNIDDCQHIEAAGKEQGYPQESSSISAMPLTNDETGSQQRDLDQDAPADIVLCR